MIDPIGDQMRTSSQNFAARIRRYSGLFAFAVAISQGYGFAEAQESAKPGVLSRFSSKFSREESGKKMVQATGLNQSLGQRIAATPDDSAVKKVLFQDSPPAAPSLPATGTPGLVSPGPSNIELSLPAAERAFAGGEPTGTEAAAEAAAEEEAPPTFLNRVLGLEDSPVKLYGWIQNSFTGNPGQPKNGFNFGVNPNYQANQWQGNQYYLVLENALEQSDELNFGFRIDSLFGNDANWNHMVGVLNNAYPFPYFPGWDPAQFYGEAHLPILTEGGVDVKFGRWYTLHGYEVVPATGRPLLSVPYMFNYGQPFTHVGLMTTWHATKQLNIYNGTTPGWDRFFNTKYKWGYMGGFAWTSEDAKFNLTSIYSVSHGQFPNFFNANTPTYPFGQAWAGYRPGQNNIQYEGSWRNFFTTVASYKWSDKLTQVMETDQGFENSVAGIGPIGQQGPVPVNTPAKQVTWYSFGNWYLYNFSEKVTGVWRSEVFWDPSGGRTGLQNNYYGQTLGLIYKPKDWLWIRPEVRYDWSQFKPAYIDNTKMNQFTLGFDVIVTF
jgi:hypothetical protein